MTLLYVHGCPCNLAWVHGSAWKRMGQAAGAPAADCPCLCAARAACELGSVGRTGLPVRDACCMSHPLNDANLWTCSWIIQHRRTCSREGRTAGSALGSHYLSFMSKSVYACLRAYEGIFMPGLPFHERMGGGAGDLLATCVSVLCNALFFAPAPPLSRAQSTRIPTPRCKKQNACLHISKHEPTCQINFRV